MQPGILVVDDEPLIRWSLTSGSPRRAIGCSRPKPRPRRSSARRDGVDLVLLDYRLPDADGLDGPQADQGASPDTLVILLTAHSTRRDGGRGDEARRVSLRQQAVQPRRNRAAGREGARNDAAAPRGAGAAGQPGAAATASTRIVGESTAIVAHAGAAAEDCRQPGLDGAAHRRERHGQGPGRESHPLRQRPRGASRS